MGQCLSLNFKINFFQVQKLRNIFLLICAVSYIFLNFSKTNCFIQCTPLCSRLLFFSPLILFNGAYNFGMVWEPGFKLMVTWGLNFPHNGYHYNTFISPIRRATLGESREREIIQRKIFDFSGTIFPINVYDLHK